MNCQIICSLALKSVTRFFTEFYLLKNKNNGNFMY